MMAPTPTVTTGGGRDKKNCPICGKPKKDHSFIQLKECWHKAKGYEPSSYRPDKPYRKGHDAVQNDGKNKDYIYAQEKAIL